MTCLVTGGAGFIGSAFARRLFARGDCRILILDSLTYAASPLNLTDEMRASDRFEFWYGDVTDPELVSSLTARSDAVFHFAAETHVARSIYNDRAFFATDIMGTQAVASAVNRHQEKVSLFVHISTSEVYGSAQRTPMDEEHPLLPTTPYAAAKTGADRLVYSYIRTYSIPAVIVRPFNNYGPRQHLEKAVPRFVTSALLGEPLTVHGDGSSRRDWLYVEDTCNALEALLDGERGRFMGKTVNLGSGRSSSILELAKAVAELAGGAKIIHTAERPGQVVEHRADAGLAKELLGWEPEVSLEEGLATTYEWYRENRRWWEGQLWMRRVPIRTDKGTFEY